jgi:hypothetical protein
MPSMPGKVQVNMHSVQDADYFAKKEQKKTSSSMLTSRKPLKKVLDHTYMHY